MDNLIRPHLVHKLLHLAEREMWVSYDDEADVLYLSFRKPQQANDSIMQDDGNIYHYADDRLVGITVPDASQKGISLRKS